MARKTVTLGVVKLDIRYTKKVSDPTWEYSVGGSKPKTIYALCDRYTEDLFVPRPETIVKFVKSGKKSFRLEKDSNEWIRFSLADRIFFFNYMVEAKK